ncbi:MAG: polysaccharide pyruvyl transferase family protein [Actinomycetota bacterium]|nr:polysaccharide pyruvyl transferase family protein [Actinomycetota bacterium]
MILVLHGARANAGDFLIRDRGLAILRRVCANQDLVLHPRWERIPPSLFDQADAVVLCGGPGLAPGFYPKIFPLVRRLEEHPTPVLPLALGWSGMNSQRPDRFFSRRSVEALQTIHSRIGWSGVRDDLSLELVRSIDVGEVRRTGCVAWYELELLGRPFEPPHKIRRVVFTPPAKRRPGGLRESLRLLRVVRNRYPDAQRWCVFHRGMRMRKEVSAETSTAERRATATAARMLGFRVIDASGTSDAVESYGECDLHIGYRVHAHLGMLSRRRPSLLVIEDGRGAGQSMTLHDPYHLRAGSAGLVDAVDQALAREEASRFAATAHAVEEIEATWPVMRDTVTQLPH